MCPLAPLFISSGVESANRMPAAPCMWAYRPKQSAEVQSESQSGEQKWFLHYF